VSEVFLVTKIGLYSDKELSMKDVRSQRGWGLSSADIFRTRKVLQVRTSTLFSAKTSNFSKFMMCPQGVRGLTRQTFCIQLRGRRSRFFSILCGRPYGRSLIEIGGYTILQAGKAIKCFEVPRMQHLLLLRSHDNVNPWCRVGTMMSKENFFAWGGREWSSGILFWK